MCAVGPWAGAGGKWLRAAARGVGLQAAVRGLSLRAAVSGAGLLAALCGVVLVAAGLVAAGEGAGSVQATGPEAWKALSVPDLAVLARQLQAKGPAGQAEREQLGALVASRYAAAAAAGRIEWPAWLDLLGAAGGQVPGEDRQRMVQDIRRELLPNAGVLGRHGAEGLGRICRALAGLGEPA